ncbi:MAG: acyl-CoA dehydrogenase family protein [Chloroflexota bacterium]|nr:acyl-CoA dehydrogenase family protein [Chloroflexota bacterium]
MNFRLTPEQEALRKEFDDFFREEMKNAPPGYSGGIETMFGGDEETWQFHRYMAQKLGAKGWLSLPWPKEYGGQEHDLVSQFIFNLVMGYHRAPGIGAGIMMLAPTLLAAGNEEQKKQFLPPIARGEVDWCQGWSEPNAGSDLASLTTRAVRDGDEYILNGQKIWTSGAHHSDWMFLLARTNPELKRSRGISFLLLDMKTPGITVRPILNMDGAHSFNEVFFDDVRVPVKNRVGEEDQGWAVTRMTMNFERSGVGGFAGNLRNLEDLVGFCKETVWYGRPLIEDPLVRRHLAQMAIETKVGEAMARRLNWRMQKGEMVIAEASASKAWGSESHQRIIYAACEIIGLYGQVKKSKWAPLYGRFAKAYELGCSLNLGGGSSEIQRNLVAWVGLELPRV